tara:strand:- start:124 stop:666 length:543 start_codon:yes stop_codon:yes gene_type:complete
MNSIERILNLCNVITGVDITDKCRRRNDYVYGRAVFYSVVKEIYPLATLHQLGHMTKRDHASVLFALRNAKDTYLVDPIYINLYNRVREKINQDPASYDLRHEKALSKMNASAAQYVTELHNKLSDAKKEIEELNNKLSNNVLWEYVSQIPEDSINEFIQYRIIPYLNMKLYKQNTTSNG